MTRVLVTDAGRGSAIAFIRSLGRRGAEVIAADEDPRSPGFVSRWTAGCVLYPSPLRAPEEMVQTLLDAASRLAVDVVVPVTDEVILPLAAARRRFEGVARLALPEPEALARAADKVATLELARELGIPVPKTLVVRTGEEAAAAARELAWPIVVKPQVSKRYRGGEGIEAFHVRYADTPDRLRAAVAELEGRCAALLQAYVEGAGVGVELLACDGESLAAFQHRRLHEVPVSGGASALRESVPLDPLLLEYSTRLMRALRWHGLAMVEFKLGPKGPALMEVNGRVWGSLPLAVKSGVDFPALLLDVLLSGSARAAGLDGVYRTGVRSRNLQLEVLWILSVLRGDSRYPFLPRPPRRAALSAAARLLWPGDGYDVLSIRDLRPGLAELRKVGRALVRKALRG